MSEPTDREAADGTHLVRVRAQVMTREDSTGGWVPLGGGGLSHVAVRKRKIHHEEDPPCKHEYLVYGKRISDQKVVMSCTIKRDFVYNRVMPTFHHWKTGNVKYGLTFQTAADARAFDRAVKIATDDLLSGLSSPVNPLGQLNRDVEDDGDIFETLELPLERDSSSSSPGSPPPVPPSVSDPVPDTHARITMGPGLQRSRTVSGVPRNLRPNNRSPGLPPPDPGPLGDNIYEWLHKSEKPLRTKISEEDLDDLEKLKHRGGGQPSDGYLEKDSLYLSYQIALRQQPGVPHNSDPRYVKLPGEDFYGSDAYVKLDIIPSDPQYHYPNLEPTKGLHHKSENTEDLKGDISFSKYTSSSPTSSKKKQLKEKDKKKFKGDPKKSSGRLHQERCVHCHELFSESENSRGSCRYSPDLIKQGIECVSCLACAKCLLYHCHYEEENFTDDDICTCDNTDGQLGKRWLGLSLLAVLVPCLCLFPLLTACHACGRACKMCGGRHVTS